MTSVRRCWGLAKGAAGSPRRVQSQSVWFGAPQDRAATTTTAEWFTVSSLIYNLVIYLQFVLFLYHCDSSQQQDQHSSIGVQAACSSNQDNDMQVTIQTTQLVVTLKFTKQKFKPYMSSDAEKDLHSPAINGGSVVPEHFRYVFYDTN